MYDIYIDRSDRLLYLITNLLHGLDQIFTSEIPNIYLGVEKKKIDMSSVAKLTCKNDFARTQYQF